MFISKPHKISNFKQKLDEDEGGHRCREKNSDTDDEEFDNTLACPTLEIVVLSYTEMMPNYLVPSDPRNACFKIIYIDLD